MIRSEFKSLGYDFRIPHLCTVTAARKRRLLRSRGIEALFQEGTNLDNVDKLLYDSGIIAYRMAIKNSKEAIRRLKNEVDDFKASFDQT